jgi:hypothetical protein
LGSAHRAGPARTAFRAMALAVAMTALAAATAAADSGPRVRHTPAGQAAARLAVPTAADFAMIGRGWQRAPVDLSSNSQTNCAGFDPNESEFIEIGSAESNFGHAGGLTVHTSASILQTEAMVRADVKRTITAGGFLACMKQYIAQGLSVHGATVAHLAAGKMAFTACGDSTRAFRFTMNVTEPKRPTIPIFLDLVVFTRGRTEVAILAGAPMLPGFGRLLNLVEANLAARLAARARA